jgi:hypothetical protein
VSRYPAKHNRLPWLVKVGQFTQDLSNNGMVRKATNETMQSAQGGYRQADDVIAGGG